MSLSLNTIQYMTLTCTSSFRLQEIAAILQKSCRRPSSYFDASLQYVSEGSIDSKFTLAKVIARHESGNKSELLITELTKTGIEISNFNNRRDITSFRRSFWNLASELGYYWEP